MDWLTQNWIWLALIAGAAALYFGRSGRGAGHGAHGGCCSGNGDRQTTRSAETEPQTGASKNTNLQAHRNVSSVVR